MGLILDFSPLVLLPFLFSDKEFIIMIPVAGSPLWLYFSKLQDTNYLLPHSRLSKDDTLFTRPSGFIQKMCLWPASFSCCSTICILPCSLPIFSILLIALSLSQLKFCDIGYHKANGQIILFLIISALSEVVLRIFLPELNRGTTHR